MIRRQPPGATANFWPQDANGNPVTTVNQDNNYGWEYVWHCHLLGHEENDMMRAIVFDVNAKTEILWRNTCNGQNAIWYMDGVNILGAALLPTGC